MPKIIEAENLISACRLNKRQTNLDLSGLELSHIPSEVQYCTHVTYLNISKNQIGKIENLNKLISLKYLNISKNKLVKIEGIDKLINLKYLYLYDNQIDEIENLENLINLEELFFSGNRIGKIQGLNNLVNLKKLTLHANEINKIENLDTLIKLKRLFLHANQIHKIENLQNLVNLNELFAPFNNIVKLENLESLVNLKILHLHGNKIEEIENLDKLINLKKLYLSHNKISKIKNLEALLNLKELYLHVNYISVIENLNELKNLNVLHLYDNEILEISGLDNLKSLSILSLFNNKISKVSNFNIAVLKQLKNIDLNGNPIYDLPIDSLDNVRAIADYLTQKENNQLIHNLYLKINILGEGRIGKTQLFRFFENTNYQENDSETHGTNTCTYTLPEKSITANIWDFGGQAYHHGFHQIFIGRTDFNIVLWRNQPDQSPDYSYWLGTARSFTVTDQNDEQYASPLLLVQNVWTTQSDKKNLADTTVYPLSGIVERYQIGLNDIFAIDIRALHIKDPLWENRHAYFLSQFHERMVSHAQRLQIPKQWLALKKELDNNVKGLNFNLRRTEFAKIYANFIDDDLDGILSYLTFTGNLLYFPNHERLNKYVFPNPPLLSNWLFNVVLGKDFAITNRGEISNLSLRDRLKSKGQVSIFLNLMFNFQLIFKKPSQQSSYIIPQFLPENNDSFKRVLLELLPFTFSLWFFDFFHVGKIFQFIARFGQYAIDDNSYWKYGLLYRHPVRVGYKDVNLQVIIYYQDKQRQLMVHIEDKKGRSEVARQLFDYFVFDQVPISIASSPETSGDSLSTVNIEALAIQQMNQQSRRRQEDLKTIIWLSTWKNYYVDIAETIKNLTAGYRIGTCVKTQERIQLNYMAINLLSSDDNRKVRVFFSYSHKDELYRNELDNHCAMLKRSGRIETWHDRKIVAGQRWDEEIKRQLQEADIVLLMLSADFLSSDYIWEQELDIVRKRVDNKDGLLIIPIFTRNCDTSEFDMMVYQGAQKDKSSQMPWIASSLDRDEVYAGIVARIREAIYSLK